MARPEELGGRTGAVATPHRAATAAGRDVLQAGGNALDAAIAANAMLAVAYPHMCGLGGDLFLLYFEAASGTVHCLNATGPAPAAATPAAVAERGLDAVPARGPLSVTVPGAVAGWDAALARFGTRPLGDLLAPAAAMARDGVEVTDRLAGWIADTQADLEVDATLRRQFLDAGGASLGAGAALRQPALATSLDRIARAGGRDLYDGELGVAIAGAVQAAGGLLSAGDLRGYQPEWTVPIRRLHAGLDVVTTPPNSQGIAALLMLQRMGEPGGDRPGSAAYVERFVAAKRHAFGLRDGHVTDPAHMVLSTDDLLAGAGTAAAEPVTPPVGGDTVFLCTSDAEGNACSLIQSLYYAFGSCLVAGDTGVLLHNRAHYFSLDGQAANVLAPGKRTLHTLMACMALEDGRPRFVFGTMGADGQPQANVQVLHRLASGAGAEEAVAAPRVLHGRFVLEDDPETLHVEADFAPAALADLRERVPGVQVVPARSERMGHAQAIALGARGVLSAGADPRSDGSAELVGAG